MPKYDVVIIGGGLAGATAAAAAAKNGANVALLSGKPGASAMFSGVFDITQNPTAPHPLRRHEARSVMDDLAAIADLNPHHPYAALAGYPAGGMESTESALKKAFAFLAAGLAASGTPVGDSLERNLLMGTCAGTARASRLALASIERGDFNALDAARLHIVGIRGLAGFNENYMARSIKFLLRNLRPEALADATSAQALFPGYEQSVNLTGSALAELLDDPATLEAFAQNVAASTPKSATHVAFAPIIGFRNHAAAIAALEKIVGLPVFEFSSIHPGVPGLRLQNSLESMVASSGASRFIGQAGSVETEGRHVRAVYFNDENGVESVYEAKRFVLATGRFLSGGVEQREEMRETIFNLPVFWKKKPVRGSLIGDLVSPMISDKQPIFSCGLRVDAAQFPLDEDGNIVYENLAAAGSVIGGYDALRDRCGAGVATLTGYLAGVRSAGGAP